MHEIARARCLTVKYGGNAMTPRADAALLREVAALASDGCRVAIVHGGGPEIDDALARDGASPSRVDGQRVTDGRTLEIAEAVLCGTINKRLVRACAHYGIRAAGISGQDGRCVVAKTMLAANGASLGYVGAVTCVDTNLLDALFETGHVVVLAPIAANADPHADRPLNVNADAVAGAVAGALRADALVLMTNVARVLRNPGDVNSGIDCFTIEEAACFVESDACRQNMKPKLRAALDTARAGVATYITNASIASALAGNATVITAQT